MILSDKDILRYLSEGIIKITPKPDINVQLGTCSIDFRLGNIFQVFEYSKTPSIDLRQDLDLTKLMRRVEIKDNETFTMQPGDFVLAGTRESLELPSNIMARLEGRSSLARLGIIVHSTAGLFDPGWVGIATLELGNLGRIPVQLYPGMRICAFTFEKVSSKTAVPYRDKPTNKYAGQMEPQISRFGKDIKL